MIKLFTDSDLDGVSCKILAIKEYGYKNVDVLLCTPYTINKEVKEFILSKEYTKYKHVYITDLSVDEEVAELINESDITINLIDHHKTALWLNKYSWAHVIIENGQKLTCGAYEFLFYLKETCQDKNAFSYCNMVRKYDTWEWFDRNDYAPKYLNDLFYFFGEERWTNNILKELINGKFNILNEYSEIINCLQKEETEYLETKLNSVTFTDYKGYIGGVVFAENHGSMLGNYLCNNLDIDIAIIIVGNSKISLRTIRDDIDLSEIVKEYGGGGHPKAAGYKINHTNSNKIFNLYTK